VSLEAALGTGQSLYVELEYMLATNASLQLRWGADQGLIFSEPQQHAALGSNGALIGPAAYPPRVEAGRAPGLWQQVRIWVTSDGGVNGGMINGVITHSGVRTGQPQGGSPWHLTFAPSGGVAVRNIRYAVTEGLMPESLAQSFDFPTQRAIIVAPDKHPVVQRCFIQDGLIKRTYCVAVGEPQGIHYVIDQAQATILGVWKGEFYDASTMWISRGEPQVAQPLGNVVWFDGKPLVATLASAKSAWPDSAQTGLRIEGYELDGERRPTFTYVFNGMSITDHVRPVKNFQTLERSLSITHNGQSGMWLRLASGKEIREVGKGRYAIDDMTYYIQLPNVKGVDATVREVSGVAELLIAVKGDMELTY